MNNFMRKLHGADDDADTVKKAGSKNETHGNAKEKKAAAGALPKGVKTVPEVRTGGRNQVKGVTQSNTRNGDGKPRRNQSGDKAKQSSNGKRNRSPKGESEKSSEPVPTEEPPKTVTQEVVEEITISEVKPETIVAEADKKEEEPA